MTSNGDTDVDAKTSGDNASVDHVAIRVPPFWPEDPVLWFAQLERQFVTANVSADATKYAYVVGNLEAQYSREVRDILVNPPAAEKYATLKKAIIERLSASSHPDKPAIPAPIITTLGSFGAVSRLFGVHGLNGG
ncbi:hypothetical protein J437_LFUL017750 [Ladona fulva]|uniref:DUF7041 domain-containing protein n=1 Tax=Ladona fulva TaxID=123851 RepID=A0A8K0KUL5_LADFU|nr:hypothetical protein J437_LFUL017750 [Ladona fulva]